jgi:hypothetical protein
MKIMVKTNSKGMWQKVEEWAFGKEVALQELLAANPDLIPVEMLGDERKPFRVSVREAGLPGSGQTDLIGIDEDGNIAIVEAKLAANQDIKRKVIGQILEYGAYLWKKSYTEFDEIVRARRNGRSLIDLMQEAPKEEEDWSADDFRDAVTDNLNEGRFGLFIVVDEINEELRRIIDFLSSKSLGDLHLYALELKYFKTEQGEVVLPQMYGSGESTASRPGSAIWDETRFLARAAETLGESDELHLLRDMYEFLKECRYVLKWGRGKDAGRVAFRLPDSGSKDGFITVVRLKSDGTVKLGLGRLPSEIGPDRAVEVAERLVKTVKVPAVQKWAEETYFTNGKTLKPGWPGTGRPLAVLLPDPQSRKQFKDGLAAFAVSHSN